jgi:hypothetical protein
MCESCGGAADPSTERKPLWTRRQLVGMGLSLGAGLALGIAIWPQKNAKNPATTLFSVKKPHTTSTTTNSPLAAASHPETQIASAPSSTPATGADTQSCQEVTSAAETAANTAPDLGAEVFPDASGRPIARASDAPVILIPRTDWTEARPKLEMIVPMAGVQKITVHHTAGEFETDAWSPTAGNLESIRAFHSDTGPKGRNWADIAYHFAIDRAGRVWQARPLAYQGAHARQHNEHNMGIVLLGNFDVQSPSAAQLTALREFIGFVRKLYDIPLEEVHTHGELVDTECPGKHLQAFMDRTREAWARA